MLDQDAIDYLAKEIKFLRDRIDAKRQATDSLLRQERRARKGGKPTERIEGENYGELDPFDLLGCSIMKPTAGFVTFKTIAEAHRIARTHRGRLKELYGAQLALAPTPHDIVWDNIPREPAEVGSRRAFGFLVISVVCFFNTLPVSLPFFNDLF